MQRKSIKLQGETDETRDGANDGGRGEREVPLLCTFIGIATHIIHILYLFFFLFVRSNDDTYFCIWHHNVAGAIVALLPDFVEPVLGLTE